MKSQNNCIPALRFPYFDKIWQGFKLGQKATFSKGKGISKADISNDGTTECIRYGELYTDYNEIISVVKSRTALNVDDLVLSKSNDVIIPASGETHIDIATASCILKDGIAIGGDLNIIRSPVNGIFLSYYLNSKAKIQIARFAQGISVVHIYADQLKLIDINLPEEPEQQKIADFLTAVDERIQQLTKKKQLLEQYKKGVMQQLFSQQLRFKDENGKGFPEWEKSEMHKYVQINKGQQLNRSSLTNGGLYPALNGGIEPSGFTNTWNKEGNTISISEGGNSCGYVNYNKGRFWSGGHCYTIDRIDTSVDKEYLFHYLKFKQADIMRLRVGSGLPNIQKKDILKFMLLIPAVDEQIKIAGFLNSLDLKNEVLNSQIIATQQYKKSLLQQMLV